MHQWRIRSPLIGRFSLRINHGATPFWCAFDYRVTDDPTVATLLVRDPPTMDITTSTWMEHLRNGMDGCWQELANDGFALMGVLVTIEHLVSHPQTTTNRGCAYYGSAFLSWLFRDYATPAVLPVPGQTVRLSLRDRPLFSDTYLLFDAEMGIGDASRGIELTLISLDSSQSPPTPTQVAAALEHLQRAFSTLLGLCGVGALVQIRNLAASSWYTQHQHYSSVDLRRIRQAFNRR